MNMIDWTIQDNQCVMGPMMVQYNCGDGHAIDGHSPQVTYTERWETWIIGDDLYGDRCDFILVIPRKAKDKAPIQMFEMYMYYLRT